MHRREDQQDPENFAHGAAPLYKITAAAKRLGGVFETLFRRQAAQEARVPLPKRLKQLVDSTRWRFPKLDFRDRPGYERFGGGSSI